MGYRPLSVERDILDVRNGFVDQDVPVLAGVLSRFLVALVFVGSGKELDSRASLDIRGCACTCVCECARVCASVHACVCVCVCVCMCECKLSS